MPECRWVVLYQVKNVWQKKRASWMDPKRRGNPGRYLRVLNWASEYGLSFEVYGRLWVLVTPRSVRRSATGFDFMEEPLSACRVSMYGSIPCLSHVSSMSLLASSADSLVATIHPTT